MITLVTSTERNDHISMAYYWINKLDGTYI